MKPVLGVTSQLTQHRHCHGGLRLQMYEKQLSVSPVIETEAVHCAPGWVVHPCQKGVLSQQLSAVLRRPEAELDGC